MTRQETLEVLSAHKAEMVHRFGVARLALFGSTARDEAGPDSDVDLLVAFAGKVTFDGYMDLHAFLQNLLGVKVDLATDAMIKPRMRSRMERERVEVR